MTLKAHARPLIDETRAVSVPVTYDVSHWGPLDSTNSYC